MNAAIEETGAVLMGRRTFEMVDPDPYVDVMPVLLGAGLRLLERVEQVELKKIAVQQVRARTSLSFRVVGAAGRKDRGT